MPTLSPLSEKGIASSCSEDNAVKAVTGNKITGRNQPTASGTCRRAASSIRTERLIRNRLCSRCSAASQRSSTGRDPRRTRRQRDPLVQLDEVAERRNPVRPTGGAFDLRAPALVAEHEQVGDASVVEAERDPRVDRVQERALAFDPEEVAAALSSLDDEPLGVYRSRNPIPSKSPSAGAPTDGRSRPRPSAAATTVTRTTAADGT